MMRAALKTAVILGILSSALRAQSPIEFRADVPAHTGGWSSDGRVYCIDVFGSPYAELLTVNQNTLSIEDRHTGGTANFVAYTFGEAVSSVAVADLNADGARDVIIMRAIGPTPPNTAPIGIDVAGTANPIDLTLSSTVLNPVHAADMDADGDIDIVCGGQIWTNSGTATFGAPTTFYAGGFSTLDVAPGDVEGDGDTDLIATFIGNAPAGPGLVSRIHRQNADHSLTLLVGQLLVPGATSAVTNVGDMNADGRADVVFLAEDGVQAMGLDDHAIIGQSLGGTTPTLVATPSRSMTGSAQTPLTLPIADFDGDGRQDVVAAATVSEDTYSGRVLSIYMTDASGALVPARGRALASVIFGTTTTAAIGAAAGDDDQDGLTDIIVAPSQTVTTWLRNLGAAAAPINPVISESIGPDVVMIAPMNPNIAFGITDGFGGPEMRGHSITFAMTLPNGNPIAETHTLGANSIFRIPNAPITQPFAATVTTSDGTVHSFTVHPTATFANLSGTNQSTNVAAPFASPVTARLLGASGQPLVGVIVRYEGLGYTEATPPAVATDVNGFASFSATAKFVSGIVPAKLSVADGHVTTSFNLTVNGDVVQIDAPALLACIGQSVWVTGHVFDASGTPRAGTTVTWTGSAVTPALQSTTTAADGSFAFSVSSPTPGIVNYSIAAPTAVTVSGAIAFGIDQISIAGGDQQTFYSGETAPLPLVVSATVGCNAPPGSTVTFTTTAPGVTITPSTAILNAQGLASVAVSAADVAQGNVTIHAAVGSAAGVDFQLFVRHMEVLRVGVLVAFSATLEHANVPLILAVDAPTVPATVTPWGTVRTSILAPGPSFAMIDGVGLFGPAAPQMTTNAGGHWSRVLNVVPMGLSLIAQIYGYDSGSPFPLDYIVSNAVTFTL